MADVAAKQAPSGTEPPHVSASRSLFSPVATFGEDRLVWTFVAVSAVVHLLVIFFGGLSWLRSKPPIDMEDQGTIVDLMADEPATKTALPKAEIAPEAKAPQELLPQLPKKFAVKEPTKPDESVAEEKEKEKEPPKDAKPAEQPKPAEELNVKTETKDDNQMDQKEILKRAALERLRLEEKTAKTAEAPEKDPLAAIADALQKNKKAGGSAAAKGLAKAYGAQLRQAVRANYSLPEAYNLKGTTLKVMIAITVSERGDLLDLEIKQPSGDPTFDELTVAAVKASTPLPKPPAGMAGEAIALVFTP